MFKKLNKMKIGARLKNLSDRLFSFWNIISTGCSDYALYDKQLWNDTG